MHPSVHIIDLENKSLMNRVSECMHKSGTAGIICHTQSTLCNLGALNKKYLKCIVYLVWSALKFTSNNYPISVLMEPVALKLSGKAFAL